MTFGEGVHTVPQIRSVVDPDDFLIYSYPNLYLTNPTLKDSLARRLVDETDIDYSADREAWSF
jgi:hypothetical protein